MAVSQGRENVTDGPEDLTQIKRKLAWRMGVAGVMIIGLLGGLWLFDSMTATRSQPEPLAPQFTEPVPVAKKTVTQPLTSTEPVAESKEGTKSAVPETTAAPADRMSPAALPPPPQIAAQPSTARQEKAPVRTPAAGSTAAAPARSAGARVDAPSASALSNNQAGAGSPAGTGSPAVSASQRQPQVLPRLLSGISLQAGVFADPRRAEEVHARLLQEGIPATLETRVLVGPFSNRTEADAARAKMAAMGIDSVQLPKTGKK